MANRRFEQFQLSLEKGVVSLYAYVAIGSTGAPTLTTSKCKGISSIARNSAGNYTITLQDSYQYLMSMAAVVLKASGVPATGSNVQCALRAESSSSATPTINFAFLKSDGTEIELVSGCALYIRFDLKNSTV